MESGSEGSDDEEYQNMIWGRTFNINYRIIPKEVRFFIVQVLFFEILNLL